MIELNIIDTGCDDYTLKSMVGLPTINQDELHKAMDRSGLVQKEITVQGKHGTFTRKQWVRASEAPTSDGSHWTKTGTSDEAKKQITQMLASGKSREDLMSEFKSKGVTWKESDNAGINWMRASMAINRWLTAQAGSNPVDSQQGSLVDNPQGGSLQDKLDSLQNELKDVESELSKISSGADKVFDEVYDAKLDELKKDSQTAYYSGAWQTKQAAKAAKEAMNNYKGYGDLKAKQIELKDRILQMEARIKAAEISGGKAHINRDSQLYESLDASIVDQISGAVESAEPVAKTAWLLYEHNLKAGSYRYKGRAHYDDTRSAKCVNMNLYKDIEKVEEAEKWDTDHPDQAESSVESIETKFCTFFHEFYHNLDHIVEPVYKGEGRYYSEGYKNGLFPQTIRDEVSEMADAKWNERKKIAKECTKEFNRANLDKLHSAGFINKRMYDTYVEYESHLNDPTDKWWVDEGFTASYVKTPEDRRKLMLGDLQDKKKDRLGIWKRTHKEYAYKEISDELRKIPSRDRSGIADVFEGATKGKVYAGWGHGNSYWSYKGQDMLALEAFANMGSAWMDKASNKQMENFKKWLPKSSAVFEDMLKTLSGEVW